MQNSRRGGGGGEGEGEEEEEEEGEKDFESDEEQEGDEEEKQQQQLSKRLSYECFELDKQHFYEMYRYEDNYVFKIEIVNAI